MALDLLSALMGGIGSEQDYQAANPFYTSGQSMIANQLPTATTNAQALWGPIAQGFLGGALAGYGKKQARQSMWDDFRGNPLATQASQNIGPVLSGSNYAEMLSGDLSNPTPGPDWNPAKTRSDVILGALAKQSQMEAQQKADAIKAELAAKTSPEALLGAQELAKATAQGTAAGTLAGGGGEGGGIFGSIPKELRSEAAKELTLKEKKKAATEFINKQFDVAASTSAASIIPGTASNTNLETSNQALLQYLQTLQGREMSGPALSAAKSLLIDFNDSPKEASIKKQKFQALVDATLGGTPIIDAMAGGTTTTSAPKYTTDQLKSAGYSDRDIAALAAQGVVN